MRNAPDTPNSLRETFDFNLTTEVLGFDLLVGALGGGGGIWLAIKHPSVLGYEVILVATVVGVVLGAVIAGVAILAAFLDQEFLRKLRAIGREPVRYVAPLLFTAFLGVVASLFLVVLGGVPPSAPTAVRATAAGLAGFTATWTLASVIPNLRMLVQFIGLQFDASLVEELPGEAQRTTPRNERRRAE